MKHIEYTFPKDLEVDDNDFNTIIGKIDTIDRANIFSTRCGDRSFIITMLEELPDSSILELGMIIGLVIARNEVKKIEL
jgi:hypothetical protein